MNGIKSGLGHARLFICRQSSTAFALLGFALSCPFLSHIMLKYQYALQVWMSLPPPCHTPTYIAHNNLRKLTFASFFSTDAFSFSCPCPTLIDLLQVRKRLGHPIHISPSCCPYTQYLDNLQNSPLLFVGFFTSIHPSCPFLCHSTSGQKVAGDRRQVVQDEEDYCASDRM